MIYVRLAGGLGNQIFQLAAALLYARRKGLNSIFLCTNGLINYKVKHGFYLNDLFNFKNFGVNIIFGNFSLINLRLPKFFKIKNFLSDKNYHLHLNDGISCSYVFLDGYFQDVFTQDEFFSISCLLFDSLNLPSSLDSVDDSACVVHVRGTDFVTLGWDKLASKAYYQSSIKHMLSIGVKNFTFVTDDPKYASSLANELKVKHDVVSRGFIEDFFLISQAKRRILSASTFAFWASALGENPLDGVVIAPKYWTPDRKRNIKLPNEVVST